MKKHFQSFLALGAFALLLTFGVSLNAQQSAPTTTDPATAPQAQPTQPTDPTAQQPATTPQAPSSQTPDASGPAAAGSQAQATTTASDDQSFSGTIVNSGDKYMFQDEASGKMYDIDHQDQVKQYEGKRVKVHGTLDPDGKTIRLQ